MAEHWLGNTEALRVLTCCDDLLLALKIPAFTPILGKDKTDEDTMAQCRSIPGRYVFLELNPKWKSYSSQQKVETLLHEMIHATLFDTEQVLEDFFRSAVGSAHAQEFYTLIKTQHENITALFEKVLRNLVDFNYPTRGTGKLVWEQGDRLLRQAP